jgi:phosphate-selective porin OprO/OprP
MKQNTTNTTLSTGVRPSSVHARRTAPLTALLLGAAALTGTSTARADFTFDPLGTPSAEETAAFDKLWGLLVLYRNNDNPILEEFKLIGKYQGQYHWVDSDQGSQNSWEDRRFRFGFDSKLFEKTIELRLTFQSTDDFAPFYAGLEDAYIKWKPNDNFTLTVGHFKPIIGYYDWVQSSDLQPTFDSSQIFNQLKVNRAAGITVEGKIQNFSWQAGAYSNDSDFEFGTFGGSYSYGAGIGYDAKKALGLGRADFRLDWLHSGHDKDDKLFTRYDDIVSATFWGQKDRYQLVVEGFGATGGSGKNGDVIGFYIQPMYDLIPKRLQLVGRYSHTNGDGPDSVIAQTRYEQDAPDLTGSGRGNAYDAFYLGFQYFIY